MKVLVFGSLNLDYVYQLDHFVRAGETISSSGRNVFCGGKGLNQSIAFSRSGAETWHAGAVGRDDGKMLLDALKEAGVETRLVLEKNMPTGHAVIQNTPDGENCIILFGGANQSITEEEVLQALAYFEPGDFLVLQNEINDNGRIMEQAKKKGMQIVLNPSPMDEKILALPLDLVDYLILNEVEAAALTETDNTEEEALLLHALMERFPQTQIILTLGRKGAVYGYQGTILHQPIYPVKAVDTTAAGDTFTGFFFGSLIQGKEIRTALDLAARASSIAVARPGASPSIPTMAEVLK